jgi:hypothetical protein
MSLARNPSRHAGMQACMISFYLATRMFVNRATEVGNSCLQLFTEATDAIRLQNFNPDPAQQHFLLR